MSFPPRKSRPSLLFNEADDVRYSAMVKAISPPKKHFSLSSRTPSSRASKATPYPTPPSKQTAGRIFPNVIMKDNTRHATPQKRLDSPSRPASSEGPDPNLPSNGQDPAAAKVHGAGSERRVCSRRVCRNELPAYVRWKTCDRCRKQSRDQQRRMRETKDAKIREAMKQQRHSPPFKYEEELEIPPNWSHLSMAERFQSYMSQLRSLGKLKLKAGQSHAPEANANEYRTSMDLYDGLASVLISAQPSRHSYKIPTGVPKPVNFRGHYYAVQDRAAPLSRERILAEVNLAEEVALLRLRSATLPVSLTSSISYRPSQERPPAGDE